MSAYLTRQEDAVRHRHTLATKLRFCAGVAAAMSLYDALHGYLWAGVFFFSNLFGYGAARDKNVASVAVYAGIAFWMFVDQVRLMVHYHTFKEGTSVEEYNAQFQTFDHALQATLYACALCFALFFVGATVDFWMTGDR